MNGRPRNTIDEMVGPVMIITVGVLFLMSKMNWGLSFSKLWPVILIVLGVMKLMASMQGRAETPAPPTPPSNLPPPPPPSIPGSGGAAS